MNEAAEIARVLVPADPGLFCRRDDPNDPRLGEWVLRGLEGLAANGVMRALARGR
jgi:hypothetical protein